MDPVPVRLVLGSASPRRREILGRLGFEHVVMAPSADETVLPGEDVDAYVTRVVELKLDAVRRAVLSGLEARHPFLLMAPEHVILVADTSVVQASDILGKPADIGEGRAMVARLSGRTHEVHTRFALGDLERDIHAETVVTRVTFRALDDEELDAYSRSGEGMDKAGGYAVQGLASGFVSRIEGSHTNVIGLPACEVVVALKRLGIVARRSSQS